MLKSYWESQPSLLHSHPPENCPFRSKSRLVGMIYWHQCTWTKFYPPPPSSGQKWTFYILSTLCHVTLCRLSTDPQTPLLSVHVVIECPLMCSDEKQTTRSSNAFHFHRNTFPKKFPRIPY
jgi:hypothetical protein